MKVVYLRLSPVFRQRLGIGRFGHTASISANAAGQGRHARSPAGYPQAPGPVLIQARCACRLPFLPLEWAARIAASPCRAMISRTRSRACPPRSGPTGVRGQRQRLILTARRDRCDAANGDVEAGGCFKLVQSLQSARYIRSRRESGAEAFAEGVDRLDLQPPGESSAAAKSRRARRRISASGAEAPISRMAASSAASSSWVQPASRSNTRPRISAAAARV